jgi:hypothetical protein
MRICQTRVQQAGILVGRIECQTVDLPDGTALPPDSIVLTDQSMPLHDWQAVSVDWQAAFTHGEIVAADFRATQGTSV